MTSTLPVQLCIARHKAADHVDRSASVIYVLRNTVEKALRKPAAVAEIRARRFLPSETFVKLATPSTMVSVIVLLSDGLL